MTITRRKVLPALALRLPVCSRVILIAMVSTCQVKKFGPSKINLITRLSQGLAAAANLWSDS